MIQHLAIEGIDGSGKDTLAARLVARLDREGFKAVPHSEPSPGTLDTYRALRGELRTGAHPKAHLHLFLADRFISEPQVAEWKTQGRVIVQVRSFFSTLVYQQDQHSLEHLCEAHEGYEHAPQLIFLLDLPVEVAWARLEGRKKEVYESPEKLKVYRERYLQLTQGYGWVLPEPGFFQPAHLQLGTGPTLVKALDGTLSPEALEEATWDTLTKSSMTRTLGGLPPLGG